MKCTQVTPETLDVFWEQIKPLLEKVVPTTYERESIESIKEKIKNKNILLWIIWDNINDIKAQIVVSTV